VAQNGHESWSTVASLTMGLATNAYSFGWGYACHPVENFRGPARIGRMLAHINARDAYILEDAATLYSTYLLDPAIRSYQITYNKIYG